MLILLSTFLLNINLFLSGCKLLVIVMIKYLTFSDKLLLFPIVLQEKG